MGRVDLRRPFYRGRQFFGAVIAGLRPLTAAEMAEAQAGLPAAAWPLFAGMSHADQRHSLNVLHALIADDQEHPALRQAALLHDCAKREGHVRIWHRVTMVLLKALRPDLLARWAAAAVPARGGWRGPLWAHLHHAARGAELAAAAGCDPVAVMLIRRHQDTPLVDDADASVSRLLAALRAADDDN